MGRTSGDGRPPLFFRRNQRAAHGTGRMLRRLYGAYNRRDAEALVTLLHSSVDWPDGPSRLHGHGAVRAYWAAHWRHLRTHDRILSVDRRGGPAWAVRIDQVVRAPGGPVISRGRFEHRYRVSAGRVTRMDIHPLPNARTAP